MFFYFDIKGLIFVDFFVQKAKFCCLWLICKSCKNGEGSEYFLQVL